MGKAEDLDRIMKGITRAAIEANRALGPRLLESASESGPSFELSQRGLRVERPKSQVGLFQLHRRDLEGRDRPWGKPVSRTPAPFPSSAVRSRTVR